MTEYWYRHTLGLQWFNEVQEYYNDNKYKTQYSSENILERNPFNVNYKWYQEIKINNRLPNIFTFQAVKNI